MRKERAEGFGTQLPPTKEQVNIYFISAGSNEEQLESFFRYYSERGWKNKKGKLFQNWKKLAWTWILNTDMKKCYL
ncbi:MAG: hypothetical protein EOO47_20315 [Flavobacterium sp.]|nr:MAG: hypothetical protein EOO47_20315 [Flavobacterium sp.]